MDGVIIEWLHRYFLAVKEDGICGDRPCVTLLLSNRKEERNRNLRMTPSKSRVKRSTDSCLGAAMV